MSRRLQWLGHAPDVSQIDYVEFANNQVVAEGSRLLFTINGKTVEVINPGFGIDTSVGTDTDQYGDAEAIKTLLQAAETALRSSGIPEFQELAYAWQEPDESTDNPYNRLQIVGPAGEPFTLSVTAPYPTVDIDVYQKGGPGQNEIQTAYFSSSPTGGTWTWSINLGSGTETSAAINGVFTAADVLAAALAGMPSLNSSANLSVTGSGTSSDPLTFEFMGSFAQTNLPQLTINVSNLTGGTGHVFVSTVQNGGQASGSPSAIVTDHFTDADNTLITAHTSDSGDSYVYQEGGTAPAKIVSNVLDMIIGTGSQHYIVNHTISGGIQITGDVKLTNPINFTGAFGFLIGAQSTSVLGTPCYGAGFFSSGVLVITDPSGVVLASGAVTHTAGTTYSLTVTVTGTSLTITSSLESISINFVDFNGTPGTYHGLFIHATGTTTNVAGTIDNFVISGITLTNEKWAISTDGLGGTFTLTKPSGGTTAAISATASVGTVAAAMATNAVYGTGNIQGDSGTGTQDDPWIVEAIGTLAGQDLSQPTGNGGNLTGLISATIDTTQNGSGPLPQIWRMWLSGATGGTYKIIYKDRKTSSLVYNANAAAVQAALEALTPGTFTGLWSVSGNGSFATPFVITALSTLAGSDLTEFFSADNHSLTGVGETLNHYTDQAATGAFFIDNSANYRDIDTGTTDILPSSGDEIYLQAGSNANSMKYGSLSGIKLKRLIVSQMFAGQIGLPQINPAGYYEYRDRAVTFEFGSYGQSQTNPNIIVGQEQGSGSGLMRIRTLASDEVHIRVEKTGGPNETGFPSLVWDMLDYGTSNPTAVNTLDIVAGVVGVAVFAFTMARLLQVYQYGGVLRFGERAELGSGGFKRFAGETTGRLTTIASLPLIFG